MYGATTSLADATSGGTWSSSSVAIATVGSTGTVGGVAVGTATITYNVTGTGTATAVVTVSATPAPAAIAGANIVCVSTHIILTDATTGGLWSSTTASIATASSAIGAVYGAAVGVDTIKYTITNSCGSVAVRHEVTVRPFGGTCVSGVSGIGTPEHTELKVFPNPNRGTFTMNLLSENDELANVAITSMWGVAVKEYSITTNTEQEINLNVPAGIYFVIATSVHGKYQAKIVVQ